MAIKKRRTRKQKQLAKQKQQRVASVQPKEVPKKPEKTVVSKTRKILVDTKYIKKDLFWSIIITCLMLILLFGIRWYLS
jgi:hypothetical protein